MEEIVQQDGSGAVCKRCGRKLKNAYQAPDGGIYGPVCIQKLGFAAAFPLPGAGKLAAVKEEKAVSDPDQLDFNL